MRVELCTGLKMLSSDGERIGVHCPGIDANFGLVTFVDGFSHTTHPRAEWRTVVKVAFLTGLSWKKLALSDTKVKKNLEVLVYNRKWSRGSHQAMT